MIHASAARFEERENEERFKELRADISVTYDAAENRRLCNNHAVHDDCKLVQILTLIY